MSDAKPEFHIFMGWTEGLSKKVASILKPWLEEFFEPCNVIVFMSDLSTPHGETATDDVKQALRIANAGIFCFTKENYANVWLAGESGAILVNPQNFNEEGEENLAFALLIGFGKNDPIFLENKFRGLIKEKHRTELSDPEQIRAMMLSLHNRLPAGYPTRAKFNKRFDKQYLKLKEELDGIPALQHNSTSNNSGMSAEIPLSDVERLVLLYMYKAGNSSYYVDSNAPFSLISSTSPTYNEIHLSLIALQLRGYVKRRCLLDAIEGFELTTNGIQEASKLATPPRGLGFPILNCSNPS